LSFPFTSIYYPTKLAKPNAIKFPLLQHQTFTISKAIIHPSKMDTHLTSFRAHRQQGPVRRRRPRAPSPPPRRAPRAEPEQEVVGWWQRVWVAAAGGGLGSILRWLTVVLRAMGR
jgi:hypothetical protein